RTPVERFGGAPEIWTFDPPRALTIDAAGYEHEREMALPPDLIHVAEREPHATLRSEVLQALIVRRPDLRGLASWMKDRGAMSATMITRAGEMEGVLILPREPERTSPLSLEEVLAFKLLADALAGMCTARAARLRSLERERT